MKKAVTWAVQSVCASAMAASQTIGATGSASAQCAFSNYIEGVMTLDTTFRSMSTENAGGSRASVTVYVVGSPVLTWSTAGVTSKYSSKSARSEPKSISIDMKLYDASTGGKIIYSGYKLTNGFVIYGSASYYSPDEDLSPAIVAISGSMGCQ